MNESLTTCRTEMIRNLESKTSKEQEGEGCGVVVKMSRKEVDSEEVGRGGRKHKLESTIASDVLHKGPPSSIYHHSLQSPNPPSIAHPLMQPAMIL